MTADIAVAIDEGGWRERFAWWWSDRAAGRPARYAWLASGILFVVLEIVGALVAQSYGELGAFAADPRWMTSALIIALSSYQLVALPRAIDRFWENVRPWLSNSDEDIASLKAQTRSLLANGGRQAPPALGIKPRAGLKAIGGLTVGRG